MWNIELQPKSIRIKTCGKEESEYKVLTSNIKDRTNQIKKKYSIYIKLPLHKQIKHDLISLYNVATAVD